MSPACHPHVVCRASTKSINLPESPNFSSVIYLVTHMSSACHPCGPWAICTLFLWSQAICTSSPWSLETGDDIRDHIWHQHSMSMPCPWSLMWSPLTEAILHYSHMHADVACMSSPETGDDISNHICLQHIINMSSLWSLMWSHWHRSSTGCLHCPRCGPHLQKSSTHCLSLVWVASTHISQLQ